MKDDWPILEGIVTTRDEDGNMHLAPMGPRVAPDWSRMLLRPFPTSNTCRNLIRDRQGVLHVTDDAELIARAAVGALDVIPNHRAAENVNGFVLEDACRVYEFRVREIDTSGERVHIDAEMLSCLRQRDFFGFNRARHAVLEAAILATRFHLLDLAEIRAEFERLAVPVVKTGSQAERSAFAFLQQKLEDQIRKGGGA